VVGIGRSVDVASGEAGDGTGWTETYGEEESGAVDLPPSNMVLQRVELRQKMLTTSRMTPNTPATKKMENLRFVLVIYQNLKLIP